MPPSLQTRRPREKKYHLSEEDVAEIRRLRFHPDPEQRKSRRELARMFGCGEIFVGMAAPLGKEEVRSKREEEEKGRRWGEKKKFIREVRKKAREEWFKGED
jgi:Mitochondrial ribosomal protein subunit L20